MTGSSEPRATPAEPLGQPALWRRLVQRFGDGDPWLAGFNLVGLCFLVVSVIGSVAAVAQQRVSGHLFPVELPLLSAVASVAVVSMSLSGMRQISLFQPWWARPFPALACVSTTLCALCFVLSLPATAPLKRTLYATSGLFLRGAVVSAALALTVGLVASWRLRRLRQANADGTQ